MILGLVYRDYMLTNISPETLLRTVAAMHMLGFDWACSRAIVLEFPTPSALVHFRMAWEGRITPMLDDDGADETSVSIEPTYRDAVVALVADRNMTGEVDLIEYVRVSLLSDRDHDRLEAEVRGRLSNGQRITSF